MISEIDIRDMKEGYLPPGTWLKVDPLKPDPVNKPKHYNSHPSGVECITITQHMPFVLGNAMKYIWRADLKNGIEDLKKARWYLDLEIKRREGVK
jgi:Protein of unknwon function (DUF3310)